MRLIGHISRVGKRPNSLTLWRRSFSADRTLVLLCSLNGSCRCAWDCLKARARRLLLRCPALSRRRAIAALIHAGIFKESFAPSSSSVSLSAKFKPLPKSSSASSPAAWFTASASEAFVVTVELSLHAQNESTGEWARIMPSPSGHALCANDMVVLMRALALSRPTSKSQNGSKMPPLLTFYKPSTAKSVAIAALVKISSCGLLFVEEAHH